MRTTDLADFSGGLREASAPSDFTEKQWAQLKGFVLTDTTRIRSQWPIQKIGDEGSFVDISTLSGRSGARYVVGIKSEGSVWYSAITTLTTSSTASTSAALSWTRITKPDASALLLNADTPRFVCDTVVITASDGLRTGLLINTVYRTTNNGIPPVVVHENAAGTGLTCVVYENGTGLAKVFPGYLPAAPSNVATTFATPITTITWVAGAAGSSAILGYHIYDSTGALRASAAAGATSATINPSTATETFWVRAYNAYGETPYTGGVQPPSNGYIPRANIGTLWNGQLVLGDIQYFKDYDDASLNLPLTSANTVRQPNGIWFSNPDAPDTFDPLAVFTVGSADSTIVGMKVVPQGLLILTTSPTVADGLILLRGASIGVINAETVSLNFRVETIRGALGGPLKDTGRGTPLALWPTIGTAVFINNDGSTWHTNTQDVLQLDEFGPRITARASASDSICTVGRYLVLSRNSRLFTMREFGQEGSWSELVYPGTVQPTSLSPLEGSVYFISDQGVGGGGKIYRLLTNASHIDSLSERGRINGSLVDLTITSRTLGDPKRFEKSMWHRVGIRARGIRSAVLKSVTVAAGALLSGSYAPLTTTYSGGKTIDERFEVVVPAHGPSIEAYSTSVYQGDLELESITFYDHGKSPRRK